MLWTKLMKILLGNDTLSLVPHCPAAVPKTFDCPPGFYCPARDDDDGKGFNAERAAELLLFCPIPSFIPQLQARQRVCNSFPLFFTCDMFIDKELASSLCFSVSSSSFFSWQQHCSPGIHLLAPLGGQQNGHRWPNRKLFNFPYTSLGCCWLSCCCDTQYDTQTIIQEEAFCASKSVQRARDWDS